MFNQIYGDFDKVKRRGVRSQLIQVYDKWLSHRSWCWKRTQIFNVPPASQR
jgi:hypothetical protein